MRQKLYVFRLRFVIKEINKCYYKLKIFSLLKYLF